MDILKALAAAGLGATAGAGLTAGSGRRRATNAAIAGTTSGLGALLLKSMLPSRTEVSDTREDADTLITGVHKLMYGDRSNSFGQAEDHMNASLDLRYLTKAMDALLKLQQVPGAKPRLGSRHNRPDRTQKVRQKLERMEAAG